MQLVGQRGMFKLSGVEAWVRADVEDDATGNDARTAST